MNLTPEELTDAINALRAENEGKPTQYFSLNDEWRDDTSLLRWNVSRVAERIANGYKVRPKPEPKVRPWTIEEINEQIGKVVVGKRNRDNPSPSVLVQTNRCMVWVGAQGPKTPQQLFEDFTMRDGSPCGVTEES